MKALIKVPEYRTSELTYIFLTRTIRSLWRPLKRLDAFSSSNYDKEGSYGVFFWEELKSLLLIFLLNLQRRSGLKIQQERFCLRIRIFNRKAVLDHGETVWWIQGLMEGHCQQEDLNTLQPHFHDIYIEQSFPMFHLLHLLQISTKYHSPYSSFLKQGEGFLLFPKALILSCFSCFSCLYIYLPHSKTSSISVSLQAQCISFPSLLALFCLLSLWLSPFLSHPVFQEAGKAWSWRSSHGVIPLLGFQRWNASGQTCCVFPILGFQVGQSGSSRRICCWGKLKEELIKLQLLLWTASFGPSMGVAV